MAGVRPRLPLEALVPGPAPVLPVEAAGLAGSAEAVPAALGASAGAAPAVSAAARAAVVAEASTAVAAAAGAAPAGDNRFFEKGRPLVLGRPFPKHASLAFRPFLKERTKELSRRGAERKPLLSPGQTAGFVSAFYVSVR